MTPGADLSARQEPWCLLARGAGQTLKGGEDQSDTVNKLTPNSSSILGLGKHSLVQDKPNFFFHFWVISFLRVQDRKDLVALTVQDLGERWGTGTIQCPPRTPGLGNQKPIQLYD